MAFKSYGGVVWNNEPTEPYISTSSQLTKLAVAVAAGGAGAYLSTKRFADGSRPIDYIAAQARATGNASPFQLLNTFRIPEIVSPFTSLEYKTRGRSQEGVTYWGKEYLANDFQKSGSTFEWLKTATGLSETELENKGLRKNPTAATHGIADALVWEPHGTGSGGNLFAVFGGEGRGVDGWQGGSRTLLSNSISLQALSHEVVNPLSGERGVNRIAASVFAASDSYANDKFTEKEVFLGRVWDDSSGKWIKKQAAFMPVPSLVGSMANPGDLARRTTMVRALGAFGMDRFNRLVSNVSDQFLGENGSKALKSIIGISPGVRPGPAGAMMLRFGGRAALAGAGIMAISQTDWLRRQGGLPGQAIASGLVSTGLGFAAGKLGQGPRASFGIAAASFFGQMVLPGFDQGVVQGVATGAVALDVLRANSLNPFSYLRRTFEGFAPGITNWETGALLGIGGVLASTLNVPGRGMSLAQSMLNSMGPSRLGILMDEQDVGRVHLANASVRDLHYRELSTLGAGLPHTTFAQRRALRKHLKEDVFPDNRMGYMQEVNAAFGRAENQKDLYSKSNPMNEALERRLMQIRDRFDPKPNWLSQFRKETEGFAAQAYHSFFGADVSADKALSRRISDMGFGSLKGLPFPTGRFGKMASVGAAIFGTHQLLTGGLLGSKESSDDLRQIYAGKKLVAVKSSRWWEAGGTPFEGGETEYYRPSQYHMMMNRVREKGIWGADEDNISPIGKFFRKNFTYELEERQYWDRPYPISSAAFADIPIIGGALSTTIGSLIKPARIMHAGEWIRPGPDGSLEYASVFKGSRMEPAFDLGAHHGIPQNPYSASAQLGFLSYQFRELEGMTGWAKNVVQKGITGKATFEGDSLRLADASLMSSDRIRFWEMQMGGGAFTNEFLRRVLPSYRSEIQRVNPVANSMPSWLPDKFKWGDPYRSIEWGEGRLPGTGYAALHPELANVDLEAYPLLYKYAILSDVAPLSAEYGMAKEIAYKKRQEGAYNQSQIAFMEEIDKRHQEAVSGFSDDRLHERAITLPGSGFTRSVWSGGQQLARKVAAPAEYFVPMGFRPVQKLMSDRGMIEQYEYERLYGTPMAFWDKPWRDWLRPSAYSAMNMMGYQGKPMWREQADSADTYFDQLEFLKWSRLQEQAELAGDRKAADQYRWAAANTRAGVNPQGSPLGMYWTLPESERKFFNAFAHASGKDRHRIAEMVPGDQAGLYKAIWSRMDSGDETLWAGAEADISDAYLQQRRGQVAQSMSSQTMPGEDWVGWHEDVDMADIKVRYVKRMGAELSDYGMWEKQLKKSMQQPMLSGSTDYIFDQGSPGHLGMKIGSGMRYLSGVPGARGNWQVGGWGGMMSTVQVDHNDNRAGDIALTMERYLSGY